MKSKCSESSVFFYKSRKFFRMSCFLYLFLPDFLNFIRVPIHLANEDTEIGPPHEGFIELCPRTFLL